MTFHSVSLEVLSGTTYLPGFSRRTEPVTVGVPFPKGLCFDPLRLTLFEAEGRQLPVQARVLDAWMDGSIRWALIDFQAETSGRGSTRVELRVDGDALRTSSRSLALTEAADSIAIDTGGAQFIIPRSGCSFFRAVTIGGRQAIDANHATLQCETPDGSIHQMRILSASVEERGPLRSAILLHGSIGGGRKAPLLEVSARLHFFAGLPTVRFEVTVRNPRSASHPGGYWDLGSGGSVFLKDLSFTIPLAPDAQPARIECSPELGFPFEIVGGPVELYQDSSGGKNWHSANHMNRRHEIPLRMRGYRMRAGRVERTGLRATPIVSLTRGDSRLAVTMPHFWQNFPKAIDATNDSIVLRLFPRQSADVHEIQGGEQKTHTFFASFEHDAATEPPLMWARERLVARAEPEWYCATEAVPHLVPAADDPHADYGRLVNAAIEGEDTFEHKREVIDEYGWRNFGDIYADHEAVGASGPRPLVSHFNNQYDAIAGFACQFLRTGDCRWWQHMQELAQHVVDIDIYHTDRDKSAYNGGLFWHTAHYVDADTATHRCYPRASRSAGGGGPSAEHNYTTGLMLDYFLTGNPQSRDAAIALARFVVNMDDGRTTPFRWLAGGRTGLATASGSFVYHGPGRAAGNSLNALLDGHRLTGDRALLEKAEEIIRRVVHPEDDIAAHQLLDVERKWFYTIFLQALGKYLDHQAERGEFDDMYRYARACLLHYARWMTVNEYPYLDKPHILEYPTETWAAQDMRKNEVFTFAAMHANEAERALFLERADFFFRSSTGTLLASPTRTLARPVVLMLTNGLVRFQEPAKDEPSDIDATVSGFGPPGSFRPQRVRAKQQFMAAAIAFVILLMGIASILSS